MKSEFRIQKIKILHIIRNSKFVILNSIFFSILVVISSCSNPYKKLSKQDYSHSQIKNIPYALPYSEKTIIYKTDIRFYKNDISGLLIIKKTDESVYRIALTTQFGLKIFDFELNQGNLNVKYCVEYLNKKIILNTFEMDFNLLLMQMNFESLTAYDNKMESQRVWQLKSGKLNYNYIQNINSDKIENIRFKKRNSEKISLGLHSYKGDIPENISLQHHNIKLEMNLKLIQ
ncbi:MAG: hypothetical protein JEY96_06470 [Bacteroidales bacterium]|nr:hypothetical protein [Bacteroidales bacterium]